MNVPDLEVILKSSILIGYGGEVKSIVGEIKLLVYINRVTSTQRFCVFDSLFCYNIIIGRPSIHEMKAFPSTYSKDCYTSSMKASTSNKNA